MCIILKRNPFYHRWMNLLFSELWNMQSYLPSLLLFCVWCFLLHFFFFIDNIQKINMQCYCVFLFRHRRDRELSILKAIGSGAETLFDIISISYANVDTKLWFPASSNVRLHVEHLAYQEMLPKVAYSFYLIIFMIDLWCIFALLDVVRI